MPTSSYFFAVTRFYSRIVLGKLSPEQISTYRRVERNFKKISFISAYTEVCKTCWMNAQLTSFISACAEACKTCSMNAELTSFISRYAEGCKTCSMNVELTSFISAYMLKLVRFAQ